jgi:hypothetical protein
MIQARTRSIVPHHWLRKRIDANRVHLGQFADIGAIRPELSKVN